MNENIYKQIPEDIMKAINSSDVYTALEKIGDDFDLNIDQIGQLNYLTEQVMIGILKSDKYIDTVSEELEINRSKARDVAESVNKMIFLPIRESMRRMQDISNGDVTPPPPRPVIKAPAITTEPSTSAQIKKEEVILPNKQEVVFSTNTADAKSGVDIQNNIDPQININTQNNTETSRKEIGEIEKMGNFTIDKHDINEPQFDDTSSDQNIAKEDMLKVIEEPEKIVEHLLPSGSDKKEPIVIKTVPGHRDDPYREPLI